MFHIFDNMNQIIEFWGISEPFEGNMNPFSTRSNWSMNIGPIQIHARETFSSSKLPTKREVLERMIWFLIPRPKGSFIPTSREIVAMQVKPTFHHREICSPLNSGGRGVSGALGVV